MLRDGVTLAAREREGGRMVGQLVMEVGGGKEGGRMVGQLVMDVGGGRRGNLALLQVHRRGECAMGEEPPSYPTLLARSVSSVYLKPLWLQTFYTLASYKLLLKENLKGFYQNIFFNNTGFNKQKIVTIVGFLPITSCSQMSSVLLPSLSSQVQ